MYSMYVTLDRICMLYVYYICYIAGDQIALLLVCCVINDSIDFDMSHNV